jgi:hypothetical protein
MAFLSACSLQVGANLLINVNYSMNLYQSFHRCAVLICAALIGLASTNSAHAQQKLVAAQSQITFVSKQMGVPVDGIFKRALMRA